MNAKTERRVTQDRPKKKEWFKPVFTDLRMGFEITMYFWNR